MWPGSNNYHTSSHWVSSCACIPMTSVARGVGRSRSISSFSFSQCSSLRNVHDPGSSRIIWAWALGLLLVRRNNLPSPSGHLNREVAMIWLKHARESGVRKGVLFIRWIFQLQSISNARTCIYKRFAVKSSGISCLALMFNLSNHQMRILHTQN